MKMDDKYLLDHKLDYLKLTLKISKLRYHGDEPPDELLQQAYEIGQLFGVSEMELKRTCSSLQPPYSGWPFGCFHLYSD